MDGKYFSLAFAEILSHFFKNQFFSISQTSYPCFRYTQKKQDEINIYQALSFQYTNCILLNIESQDATNGHIIYYPFYIYTMRWYEQVPRFFTFRSGQIRFNIFILWIKSFFFLLILLSFGQDFIYFREHILISYI